MGDEERAQDATQQPGGQAQDQEAMDTTTGDETRAQGDTPTPATQPTRDAGRRPSRHDARPQRTSDGALLLRVPALSLVALIGVSGSGKSTFAARHFAPTEVLSSDHYRAVVGDDPNDQSVTNAAFDALHHVAGLRLALGRLTVIDATNVKPQDRRGLVQLAREHDVLPVAVVLDIDERVAQARNAIRPDRQFGAHVVRNQAQALRRGLGGLAREGFRQVYILRTAEEINAVRIERTALFSDYRGEHGPFDIIGDVHGCYDELRELMGLLGYQDDPVSGMRHPDGRRAIFVGDLVDRGPGVVEVVNLVRAMVAAGQAFCAPGNHDVKLQRALSGRQVRIANGLGESLAQIEALPADERAAWSDGYRAFIDALPSHYVLDGGALVVAHAGMKQAYQGRASGRVREFALYGETTGESDEFGLPIRANWAADYRGPAAVAYGHTPVPEAAWYNNTINLDTGCVFGGKLSAMRWPERDIVSVPARKTYAEPKRPFGSALAPAPGAPWSVGDDTTTAPDSASTLDATAEAGAPTHTPYAAHGPDTLLRIEDALGKQIIETRLVGRVIVEEDRAAAALEVMSRFALDPRWLIYLPPTMSPSETATQPGWLERPEEALDYYRWQGAERVVCEEKHMGSRAVLVLCRDAQTAVRRFGADAGTPPGACYTRTGRRFFDDDALDRALVTRLSEALGASGFWERHTTDWVCLDAEIMPWSAKAQGLLREQYAPVAAAGRTALAEAHVATDAALARIQSGAAHDQLASLVERLAQREMDIARYAEAYGRYCWPTEGLNGLRIAPFHLLATEGKMYFDHDHLWHMAELARLAEADPLFMATRHRDVDLADADACNGAIAWWEELTAAGGEGMVVKSLEFIAHGPKGWAQPAIKCRGREYLRIIYGPDYDQPERLARLRKRGLSGKRALALREFALGVESLERFTRGEPLWRTHQAVFGVLALESEPVDPRL